MLVAEDQLAEDGEDLVVPAEDDGVVLLGHERAALAQLVDLVPDAVRDHADERADDEDAAEGDQSMIRMRKRAGVAAHGAGVERAHQVVPHQLGGVFIVGTLIGLISNGVGNQIEELRKGRSLVAERGHIVILGWNDQIFAIVSELVLANAPSQTNASSSWPIRTRCRWTTSPRACPTGRRRDRLPHMDSAIWRSPTSTPRAPSSSCRRRRDTPDSEVIKTILAIINPSGAPKTYHIVAEIRDRRNMEAARWSAATRRNWLPAT